MTYYDVLGVDPDADPDALRAAFRQRAQALHPDLHPDDPEADAAMRELNDAWHVLGHDLRRARYDATLRGEPDDVLLRAGYDTSGAADAPRIRAWRVPFAVIVLIALVAMLILTAYAGPSTPR